MSKNVRREIFRMSTITYKFQITIPKKVRERHQLKEGDTIIFIEEEGRLLISKSTDYQSCGQAYLEEY